MNPNRLRGGVGCNWIRFTLVLLSFWLPFTVGSLAYAQPDSPVIFIHGLASDANSWESFGRVRLRQERGWIFGGCPRLNNITVENICGAVLTSGHYYLLEFSHSQNVNLNFQDLELHFIINEVLALTGKSKVILVAHSMGGLAARHLLQFRSLPRVEKLITVGTPHAGAEIGFICQDPLLGGAICRFRNIDPHSVAIEELKPDSPTLLKMNE